MTRQLKNKIRASILLTVFSLNTVAGFACSVGVDLGYNKHHHEHHDKVTGHHEEYNGHYDEMKAGKEVSKPQHDCCSDGVAKFTLLDKSSTTSVTHQLQAPVVILTFSTSNFLPFLKEPILPVNSDFKFVRRSCFLNDTDPQITIRRFQI